MKTKPANICGTEVARLRRKDGLTQDELTRRCCAIGWPVARSVLAKIETLGRSVSDRELVVLARALRVSPMKLLKAPTRTKDPHRRPPHHDRP